MIVLRLFLLLVALILALTGALYLLSRDPRYLGFAWQVVRFTLFLLLTFAALFALERYGLAGWRLLF